MNIKAFIQLARPHQWVKNLFIFAPLFFSFKFFLNDFVNVFLGFILFSLTASGVYILNDYLDIKEDQQHPKKCYRPLAAGLISKKQALTSLIILFLISFVGAYFLHPVFFYILIAYVLMNILYTINFKHISILDICIIAIGFVLRIFAGAQLVNLIPSAWIVMVTFLLALFLALAKRRDDVLLAAQGLKTRKNIDGYNLEMINASMVLMAAVTLVCYIMYTLSEEAVLKFNSNYLYLTSVFVILGILRYLQISFVEEKSGSPTQIVLKDVFIQIVIIGWLLSFVLVYFL